MWLREHADLATVSSVVCMSCKNANSFSNTHCLVVALELMAIEKVRSGQLVQGVIKGFLGPLYVTCCTSYLTDFERSCIGCRLIVFCMGSNSAGLLMLGERTCALIIARQWKHRLQLGDNISASQLS